MEFRKLGNLQVSTVGLGTLRAFDVSSEADVAVRQEIVDSCIANEVNFIDSAAMYGNAEQVVGDTTAGRRDKFYLATKVRCQGQKEGEEQIARSFQNFNTEYIDLFQIHNMIDWQTHLPTLTQLKEQGKIGMIGVTSMRPEDYPEIIRLMRSGQIQTVQVQYNIGDRACEQELLPAAEESQAGIIVMEPLKKGRYVKELKRQPDLAPLAGLGIETWAQALLAWVLADPRVAVVIPATSRPERVNENARAGSVGRLTQEQRDYIRQETERCL